jgi:hypothetical protein
MTNNAIVPLGVSGKSTPVDHSKITHEHLVNETALLALGDFEPLNFKIDSSQFLNEIEQFSDDWQPYLPRTDRPNNRDSLTLTCLPGTDHMTNPSLAQASYAAKRRLSELEFNQKTAVYDACQSLHPFLNTWCPLGRTFLIRSNIGGYFVPHRDHPGLDRDVFRLAIFLNNCGPLDYDWLMDDRKLQIEPGRAYYVNTRKTHRTISWVNNSIHLIVNVAMTTSNVEAVIKNLQHSH